MLHHFCYSFHTVGFSLVFCCWWVCCWLGSVNWNGLWTNWLFRVCVMPFALYWYVVHCFVINIRIPDVMFRVVQNRPTFVSWITLPFSQILLLCRSHYVCSIWVIICLICLITQHRKCSERNAYNLSDQLFIVRSSLCCFFCTIRCIGTFDQDFWLFFWFHLSRDRCCILYTAFSSENLNWTWELETVMSTPLHGNA